jgi:hypothetical protein
MAVSNAHAEFSRAVKLCGAFSPTRSTPPSRLAPLAADVARVELARDELDLDAYAVARID